jgi:GntR family transcriptional regulator
MARFGVSRTTVRQALAELAASGRIYRAPGRGSFVAEPMVRRQLRLTSFTEDMAARGLIASSKILGVSYGPAGAAVGWALAVSPVEQVVRLERLRLANGKPMCLEDVYLPKGIVGDVASSVSEHVSLYATLRDQLGIRIVRADQELKPTVLSEREAQLLGLPPLSPALLTVRFSYDDHGHRIEFGKSLYRGDLYTIEVTLCLP